MRPLAHAHCREELRTHDRLSGYCLSCRGSGSDRQDLRAEPSVCAVPTCTCRAQPTQIFGCCPWECLQYFKTFRLARTEQEEPGSSVVLQVGRELLCPGHTQLPVRRVLGLMRPGCGANHSPPSSPEFSSGEAIPVLLFTFSWHCAELYITSCNWAYARWQCYINNEQYVNSNT
jgi:hypothetical protein